MDDSLFVDGVKCFNYGYNHGWHVVDGFFVCLGVCSDGGGCEGYMRNITHDHAIIALAT